MTGDVTQGLAEPLGVWPTAIGVNVAVFSSTASAIDLCLFDAADQETRIPLPGRTGDVFHGHVAGLTAGARYGLRAHGPFDPGQGLRFDSAKLLWDPYAVALDRPFALHPALFEQDADTAAVTPKAVIADIAPPAPPPRRVAWDRTVIYEAHVRGLTRLHPDIPENLRGTFAALGHPAIIDHLKGLGVTTLELLPAAAFIDERHLPPLGLTNYWGYNPIAFCAPEPRLAPGGWPEVRAATAALAQAGIETVLDVVFNHSGEGDQWGPTLSLRGLDNAGYYRLRTDDAALYVNDAGTGNILALDRPQGVALAMAAMRAWVRRGGIAGFRFDLATVMGRRPDGFDPGAPLLAAIDQDEELSALKLIAEPWDIGPGGYQLGRFPRAWGEWNDGFRDTIRRFWRGDGASLGALATRLAGSAPQLASHERPSRSVNFITAHDGFTLADLVSYAGKHNEANGEDNRDGSNDNASWNNGAEGPTDDRAVLARRAGDQRALLALLLLARGTPMLSMGAELGQSQDGNNNAYAQDNALSWIDWTHIDAGLLGFARRLAQARAAHPALREDRFLTGRAVACPWPDVDWRRGDGAAMTTGDWDDPRGAALQMVLAAPDRADGTDRVALILNRGGEAVRAALPDPRDGFAWSVELDSGDDARFGPLAEAALVLAPRSVTLVVETPAPAASQARSAPDALLAELAQAAGIGADWWTVDGEHHVVSPQTQRALLAAMGLPALTTADVQESLWRLGEAERRPLPAGLVRREGEAIALRAPDGWLTVASESGVHVRVRTEDGFARLPALPVGRYRLLSDRGEEGRLMVAPAMAFQPQAVRDGGRVWGLSVQLYGLRRSGDGGIGDFTTLGDLADGAASRGANLITLNPLHALFPADRERASPYYPSDRRFIDPMYLDIQADPPAAALLAGLPAVDYPAVWAAKAAALEAEFDMVKEALPPAFYAFVQASGQALADFTAFQVIAEAHPGQPWTAWPGGLGEARGAAVAAFLAQRPERARYHQYLQWLCEGQLAAAAARGRGLGLGFCRDLAVGAAPDGAEAWSGARRLARGASIGAPPDPLGPQGQVWGLPPPIPRLWTEEGYDGFAELLRANMAHAGALRIDHVLGLQRLFWVPEGAPGREGAYVAYPRDDLLGVLALESTRARCLVVGEDLGTAPEGLREALSRSGVFSYKVLPFERDGAVFRPPAAYPPPALACVSTHDLPPLQGWWDGADIEERSLLGLIEPQAAPAERARRRSDKAWLMRALAQAGLMDQNPDEAAADALTPALAAAIHAYVAASPAALAVAQVEDLAGEAVGVNLPGTDRERSNWRRRVARPLAELWDAEPAASILAALRAARG
jgi:glycogen operon protein